MIENFINLIFNKEKINSDIIVLKWHSRVMFATTMLTFGFAVIAERTTIGSIACSPVSKDLTVEETNSQCRWRVYSRFHEEEFLEPPLPTKEPTDFVQVDFY